MDQQVYSKPFQPLQPQGKSINYVLVALLMIASAVIAALVMYIVMDDDISESQDDEYEVIVEDSGVNEQDSSDTDINVLPGGDVFSLAQKSVYLPEGWIKDNWFTYEIDTGLEKYPLGGCYDESGDIIDCDVVILHHEDEQSPEFQYNIYVSSPGFFTEGMSFIPMGSRQEQIEVDGQMYSVAVLYAADGRYTAEDLEAGKPVTEDQLSDTPIAYHVCTEDEICFAVNLMGLRESEANEQDEMVRQFLAEVAIR